MALPAKKQAAGVPFLDLSWYQGTDFTIPEGDYAFFFHVQNETFTNGDFHVGCRLECHPLSGGEPINKFVHFGKGAADSWAPSKDGKSIVEIAEGPGVPLGKKTNWAYILKSMYDVGFKPVTDSFAEWDGVWATIQNMPEPTERASYGSSSTLQEKEEPRKAGVIPQFTAILDGGKPWEGGGGLDFTPTKKAKPGVKPLPLSMTKAGKVKPEPEPEEETGAEEVAEEDADDASTIASNAIAVVLKANKGGLSFPKLNTEVFVAVKKSSGQAMANAVMALMKDDDTMEGLLGQHGYEKAGTQVKLAK